MRVGGPRTFHVFVKVGGKKRRATVNAFSRDAAHKVVRRKYPTGVIYNIVEVRE